MIVLFIIIKTITTRNLRAAAPQRIVSKLFLSGCDKKSQQKVMVQIILFKNYYMRFVHHPLHQAINSEEK